MALFQARLALWTLLPCVALGQAPAPGDNGGLRNGGFEATSPLNGWTIAPSPPSESGISVRSDTTAAKQGRQSLLLQADRPGSASLAQELFLPVGSVWRASAWIRIEGASASPAAGLTIETPSGDQGSQRAGGGTAEWQNVSVRFRVPSPGRLSVRLTAFRNDAPGKVWFDDVRLDRESEAGSARENVEILSNRLSARPIDLKQGGQFIEPLCHLTASMIAQQVESTSFEEEPAWEPSYKREIDQPHRPWYPDGAVHLAHYSLDREHAFNGARSQKIELPAAGSWAGISQDGFYLKQGRRYRLRFHARGDHALRLRTWLHGDGGRASEIQSLELKPGDWQGMDASLAALRSTGNATLTIQFEGPGTLWLDRVYLIDENAVLGIWRPDVVEALKAMNPGVIRFGGSTLEVFEWDKCLGNWDQRAPYVTKPWGGLDPNFIGVEEFVQLCRYVGAEPLICVRWTGKHPEDAAAEVQYFNGDASTKWGRLRSQNGHPQPYHIRYWQIGNEIGGPKYDSSIRAFAEAMRQQDRSIKVLSSFPSPETLKLGGGYLDFLCPHHYEVGDLEGSEQSFRFLQDQIAKYANGRDVRAAVTEWNTTAGEMGLTRDMLLTLGNALGCSRYQNLMQRYSSLVEIAIRSNLSDSFGSGVIQPGPGWLYLAPTYYSQGLYQKAAGSFPLRIHRSEDVPSHLREPDLSASISPEGTLLRIYAVNSTPSARGVRFHLKVGDAVGAGHVFTLGDRMRARDSEVMNTRDDPARVSVVTTSLAARGSQLDYSFEPFTVTLLEIPLKAARSE